MPASKSGDRASYLPTAASTSASSTSRAGASQTSSPADVSLQQTQYRPGSPIRFYDDEVERMKREVDKTAPKHRRDARRELRARPRRTKSGITVTGFLLRAATLYVLIAYFLVCPNEPNSDRAVCRALTRTSNQLRQYEPYARPYVIQAQRQLEPYWVETHKHVQPYLDLVEPYYRKADGFARPHLATAGRLYHDRAVPVVMSTLQRARALVQPLVNKLSKQYERSIAPSVEWYSESLSRKYAPQVARADAFRRQTVVPALRNGLQAVQDAAERGQHHWHAHLVPFTHRAYSSSRQIYLGQVHPRVITVSRQAIRVWRLRVSPTLLRFWSRFIAPQLDKIRERIFEYKSKKAQVEAAARVEKASVEIAREQEQAEVEDFINDLRDEKLATSAEEAPPAYSATHAPPLPSPEEAAKLTAEKRAALEALHAAYEQEIAKLGEVQSSLLVDRLVELRQNAQNDAKAHFDGSLEKLDDEGDLMVGRLGKYFARVQADLREEEVEAKVREADALATKATARVRKAAEAIKAEVAAYRDSLEKKEAQAVSEAEAAVTSLVDKAQSELGQGYTWLEGVTAKDWQRYHGLRSAERNLHSRFADLRAGAITESRLETLEPYALLEYYTEQPVKLVAVFEQILEKIKVKGQRDLRGEWSGVANEAQKVYGAAADKLGDIVDGVKASISSAAGHEAQPTDLAGSASSRLSRGSASASSLAKRVVDAVPTPKAQSAYVDAVKSTYGDASQQVLRAVGVEPSPTDIKQSVTSLARAASSSVGDVYAAASQSLVSVVAGQPSSSGLAQSASSAASVVSKSASSILAPVVSASSSISSASSAATETVRRSASSITSSGASAVSKASRDASTAATSASSVISSQASVSQQHAASQRVEEILGEVSQGALRAVGIEPSPTDLFQSIASVEKAASKAVTSVIASDIPSSSSSLSTGVAASISSAGSSVRSAASSVTQPRVSSVSSVSSVVASSVTSVTRRAAAAASASASGENKSDSTTVQAPSGRHHSSLAAKVPRHVEL